MPAKGTAKAFWGSNERGPRYHNHYKGSAVIFVIMRPDDAGFLGLHDGWLRWAGDLLPLIGSDGMSLSLHRGCYQFCDHPGRVSLTLIVFLIQI